MDLDLEKIDDAVLALLFLTFDSRDQRAWKAFDWEAMSRLHDKGYILDPVNKAKSVLLTEEGAARAEQLCRRMFCKPGPDQPA